MELRAENISRRYFRKRGEANFFEAVKPVSLTVRGGKMTVLKGRSGSGKTTLLHMLAGLLNPSEGKVFLDDTDLYALEDAELSRVRNEKIGVVPQGRSAVDTLTVYENILLPGLLYGGTPPDGSGRRLDGGAGYQQPAGCDARGTIRGRAAQDGYRTDADRRSGRDPGGRTHR